MGNVLANVFGSSPVKPLEQHMDIVFRCAKKLRPFFEGVIARDYERMAEVPDVLYGSGIGSRLSSSRRGGHAGFYGWSW